MIHALRSATATAPNEIIESPSITVGSQHVPSQLGPCKALETDTESSSRTTTRPLSPNAPDHRPTPPPPCRLWPMRVETVSKRATHPPGLHPESTAACCDRLSCMRPMLAVSFQLSSARATLAVWLANRRADRFFFFFAKRLEKHGIRRAWPS